MKQADAASAALEALSHPLILKGAWLRVDGWFRSGNLAPEPELSRWRLHPEAALRQLGGELADNTWRPDCWQQVPYPKKGACLRHYVQPTVRDQVAFMAYLVLLGPLLDGLVPPSYSATGGIGRSPGIAVKKGHIGFIARINC